MEVIKYTQAIEMGVTAEHLRKIYDLMENESRPHEMIIPFCRDNPRRVILYCNLHDVTYFVNLLSGIETK